MEQAIDWNGRDHPYRPAGRPLVVSDRVAFHDEASAAIDPVTFEVVSTKLWNLNEEHADAIKRASGSPFVVYNDDFNTALLTERGEPVLFGPYIQFFAGASEFIVKYTLENRGDSPGIEPGDVFLHNDPLVGGSHQMDIGVYAPVFVDDRLFCWVYSSCHVRDVGGVEPGGFCVQATDVYHEPPMLRAMKIADARGIRADVEDTFLRMSRLPQLLALELRSQLVGVARAHAAVAALVGRYGAAVVKGVMQKIVDDAERAVARRLARVPDGRWTDVMYTTGAAPGDRSVHRQVLTLTKSGGRLHFANEGTDPEFGSHNCGYAQFCASIASSLAVMLAYDHRLCVGGVLRLTDFDGVPGTLTCASRNGAITCNHAHQSTIYQASQVISKMLFCDEEQRGVAMAVSGVSTGGWLMHSGTDQHGAPFASGTVEMAAGGIGAFAFRDGMDAGGAIFWPKCEISDCEITELNYPVLYLYRRRARNGGHGRYRGGHGMALGWIGHGSEDQVYSSVLMAPSLPIQAGLNGGHHGQTGLAWAAHDTPVRELLCSGSMPATRDELRAAAPGGAVLPPKATGVALRDDDVVELATYGGGGFGDPLEREPEAVASDLRDDLVPEQTVLAVYGVVLDSRGDPDLAATARRRELERRRRLDDATAPTTAARPPQPDDRVVCEVAMHLAIVRDADGSHWHACRRCGHGLGAAEHNYKAGCAVLDGSLVALDPALFTDPAQDTDVPMTYRSFLCPECGVALDHELTRADAPPLWDTRIDLATLPAPPEAAP